LVKLTLFNCEFPRLPEAAALLCGRSKRPEV
jgi:hypothetical protein